MFQLFLYFTCLKCTLCRAVREKINNLFAHKIFFWCSIIFFLSTWNTFLCQSSFFWLTWNTFSCNINTFLSTPNYFLCNVKLFVSTQNYFSCNTKFLFWTLLSMLCHGDIFLSSHSNKNIIACQKVNKLSFLCDTKKLVSFFVYHNFFIFSFYITHCQHVSSSSQWSWKQRNV